MRRVMNRGVFFNSDLNRLSTHYEQYDTPLGDVDKVIGNIRYKHVASGNGTADGNGDV